MVLLPSVAKNISPMVDLQVEMGLLGALYDESVRLPERAASPGAAKRPPLRGSLAA